MSVTIKKTGFNAQALSLHLRQDIAEVLNEGADSCVSLAQQLAPVDTGYMRDNISQTDEATSADLKATIESGADYSAFVEYGTINMDAQPFFTPAFESAKKQVNNSLLRVLR
jgi:HK97 gp10 family phage protein